MSRRAFNEALRTARSLIGQVCECGCTQGDHGALNPYGEPGTKQVGYGRCYGDDRACRCRAFKPAPLEVIICATESRRTGQ